MSEDRKVISKAEKPQRKERVPLTGLRTKLSLKGEEPGFHYAWISGERVDAALEAWYEFVTHPIQVGEQQINVGAIEGGKIYRNGGGGQQLYLMRIPQEFYDADRLEEQKAVDASEEQLYIESNSNGLSGTIQVGNRQLGKR